MMCSSSSWLSAGGASLVVPPFTAPPGPWVTVSYACGDPCPASLQLLLSLSPGIWTAPILGLPAPLAPCSPSGEQGLRWMVRQSIAPQTGWFIAPPFHLGRAEAPGGPVWRALGTSVSQTWRPCAPSPPWCQVPNGHSRMVAIRHVGRRDVP